jgi:hypothetical protein
MNYDAAIKEALRCAVYLEQAEKCLAAAIAHMEPATLEHPVMGQLKYVSDSLSEAIIAIGHIPIK